MFVIGYFMWLLATKISYYNYRNSILFGNNVIQHLTKKLKGIWRSLNYNIPVTVSKPFQEAN